MTRFLDFVRPAAGAVLMSEWLTGTAERSRLAADVVVDGWEAARRPSGRLAQHVFLSAGGAGLLFYAQWASDGDHLAWAGAHRAGAVSRVDTVVPGIRRSGLVRTRLMRSVVHDAEGPVGLFVVSAMAVDEVEAAVVPVPGLLGAHVHLASEGERVRVVTEWADAASYEAVITGGVGCQRYTLYRAFEDDRR
ncbi:antibiotic biosynthesis monooxygenase [Streptomyces albireticuli]|nr:antibiotic biosynthesis monooxygenase [Streptomyces albireticuli]